jgi:DNA-binding transcriptional LysR family regulator
VTPDLGALRTFVAVVDSGGFAEAAQRLAVSRSMVSRRMAQLEQELGSTLLMRNTRTMALTEPGRRFHGRCQQLLAELEAACEDVAGAHAAETGLLRVSAPTLLGPALLSPVLAKLARQHPRLRFEVLLEERTMDLVGEGIDLALRFGALPASNMVARSLGTLRGWVLASPEYLHTRGTPLTPADLAGHTLLGHSQAGGNDLWEFESGTPALLPLRQVRVNGFASLLVMARHGAGLVVMPTYMGQAEVQRGELVQLLAGHALASHPFSAVTPRLSPRVRLLIDALAAYAGRPKTEWGLPA